MNFLYIFSLIFFVGCSSQSMNTSDHSKESKINVPFEEMNHFPYDLVTEKYVIVNTQEKMDKIFKTIYKNGSGGRTAPIPTVVEGESYLIFKPVLKTSNEVQVSEIYLNNNILYVELLPLNDPQLENSSREAPTVLVKLLKRVNAEKVILNYKSIK